ncbi:hypothetical protein PFICI_01580 [Pestalotiopsis fici W106-1]|uniref:Cupin 2 conserved barrel domain-containing protein n=1 Tax=Pestalotiopsis fici (strain W106-1 / CGMCC3.15140) TaxID=1229662 RepID=W3XQG7_PESFW|nr:uncharacterized protein PFICI_01580 [Pestalotiopsis fici W106-1]ETS87752.1 hypothetical protein PFICI_01580 [Pestalotiopsis fici W106-1]
MVTIEDFGRVGAVGNVAARSIKDESVFRSTENDYEIPIRKSILVNDLYPTREPVADPGDIMEVKLSQENESGVAVTKGTLFRLVDFAPAAATSLQAANNVDLAVVVKGSFKIILESGEERMINCGDAAVQRANVRRWINMSNNGQDSGQILFIVQGIQDNHVDGPLIARAHGKIGQTHVKVSDHKPVVYARNDDSFDWRHDYRRYDDKFDSEF